MEMVEPERLSGTGNEPREISALARELAACRAHLELQEDELRRARRELFESRERFIGVYDALRDREARMRAILDTVFDAIVTVDERGTIESCNPAAERMFGYSAPELIGSSLDRLIPSIPDAGARRPLPELLADGGREVIGSGHEVVGVRRGRSTFPIDLSVSEARLDGRRFFTAVIRDVTEIRRKEGRMRRLATVVTDSNDAITVLDFDGNILSWNRGAQEMYGYTEEEVLHSNIRRLLPPDLRDEVQALAERLKVVRTIRSLETKRLTKDGRLLDVWLTASVLVDESELPVAIATTERDISERLAMEKRLLQSQKMEAIGQLASGIAHEFNNLVMAVGGCLDFALRTLGTHHPATPFVVQAKQTAISGASLTRELLAFGRRREHAETVLDLHVLVHDKAKMLQSLLGDEIALELELRAEEPWVCADPGQLTQVLMNLAVNSRDAMPEGGCLTISTADEVSAEGGARITLAVSDTGCGMDEETRTRAFEPFFSTKSPDTGTGLGLSTVYGIVKKSRGSIQLQSTLGEGTTVQIRLPRAPAPATGDLPVVFEAETTPHHAETVLLIEDDPLVRMTVHGYLDRAGYRVLEARDGEEARRIWSRAQEEIAVLLTDISLPLIGGHRLAREFLAQRPECQVVFMSAFPEEKLLKEGRLEPGALSLQKPFTSDELLRMVHRALSERATPLR
ncbi:MAG: PAS domain S-box protein [Deltaproteobacteria bacterium]|nr:PAS domain S-box protein [Deltaproteobacteria bacterium]